VLAETGFAQLAAYLLLRLPVQQPVRGKQLNPARAQQCVCRSKQSCRTDAIGAKYRVRNADIATVSGFSDQYVALAEGDPSRAIQTRCDERDLNGARYGRNHNYCECESKC
jgi:hypothetical protein